MPRKAATARPTGATSPSAPSTRPAAGRWWPDSIEPRACHSFPLLPWGLHFASLALGRRGVNRRQVRGATEPTAGSGRVAGRCSSGRSRVSALATPAGAMVEQQKAAVAAVTVREWSGLVSTAPRLIDFVWQESITHTLLAGCLSLLLSFSLSLFSSVLFLFFPFSFLSLFFSLRFVLSFLLSLRFHS